MRPAPLISDVSKSLAETHRNPSEKIEDRLLREGEVRAKKLNLIRETEDKQAKKLRDNLGKDLRQQTKASKPPMPKKKQRKTNKSEHLTKQYLSELSESSHRK